MKFSRSLKGRLAIIVAIAIVVTGTVVLIFSYFMAKSILRDQVFNSLDGVVTRARREIQTTVEKYVIRAEMISSSAAINQVLSEYSSGAVGGETIEQVLEESLSMIPEASTVSVLTTDGREISSASKAQFADVDQDQWVTAELIQAVTAGETYADFGLVNGRLAVIVSSPVEDEVTGEIMGVTLATSFAEDLEMLLADKSGLGDSGAFMLSKVANGEVEVVIPREKEGGPLESEDREIVFGAGEDLPMVRAALGQAGEGEMDDPGGKVVVSYDYLPELQWGLCATLDSAEAFAPISRLRNVVVIVILVLLFGGCALAYLIARSIARPLEELQHGVKALAGGDLETRVTIKDGTEVTALASEFNQMAGKLKDLYENLERKVAERTRELEEANERLRELDDLKSEFVSVASHELRSPMASMKMGVSTVVKELVGPLNEEQKLMLSIAEKNIDRLTKLTSELLDITKIEAGQLDLELAPHDLVELAGEVVEAESPQAVHLGLDVSVETPEGVDDVTVECDRDRIYQVVQNLVGNALKFTEEGRIRITVKPLDGRARLCVEDTGPGIPQDQLPSIFEKWSKSHSETPSEKRGTGLGLAICRGIVKAHGGDISAESEPGRGSRFCVEVPSRRRDVGEQEDTDSR